ncbi:hypothetical protein [Microbacterium luteum]|uniref:hypothetical protein n=1 Tax=Microbacterium luteum TaxID=2782167 RepID=UPI0018884456|nr:hypothetical protein [Microbacterium luteum]
MAYIHSDIGSDEPKARRVLARARVIAPCIFTLPAGSEEWKDGQAILQAVFAEVPKTGTRRTRTLSRNGTSMSFEASGMFTIDEIESLRGLCTPPPVATGAPVGSFPTGGVVNRLWPAGEDA